MMIRLPMRLAACKAMRLEPDVSSAAQIQDVVIGEVIRSKVCARR